MGRRCSQFDDGTRQMLALCYQEALQENGCLDLLELQDVSQHLSWKAASANEVTFACYLANKLDIRVEWEPFHPDLIASAPDATLSALACQVIFRCQSRLKELCSQPRAVILDSIPP